MFQQAYTVISLSELHENLGNFKKNAISLLDLRKLRLKKFQEVRHKKHGALQQ